MSDAAPSADDRLVVFCLHFLGGSGRGWSWVLERLPPQVRCVTIDLPGFGGSAELTGYTVEAMATFVMRTIRDVAPARWMLVGHSMGAKLAAIIVRHAEDGAPGLGGLERIVLLAGSPPGPEPMEDDRRQAMRGWFGGDDASRHEQARGFIAGATGGALAEPRRLLAVEDVLRASRPAWLAWLDGGSREDWREHVGVLQTPALIVAGAEDGDLGPDAQARLMAPHFAHHRLVTLDGAGHLLPLERPDEVARLIMDHAADQSASTPHDPASRMGIAMMGEQYWALLHSDRVSANTRQALLSRVMPEGPGAGDGVLSTDQRETLHAVLARVVPQPGGHRIDLAGTVEAALSAGDGWRRAELPADPEAWRAGLRTLDQAASETGGDRFTSLDAGAMDALLAQAAAGEFPACSAGRATGGLLTASQMQFWFEDVRSEAVRAYVAHPATLSRIGYSGIAYGGDAARKSGFVQFGIGVREPWEPEPGPPDRASSASLPVQAP